MSERQALAIFRSASGTPHWLVAYSAGADSTLLLDLALEAAAALPQVQVTAFYLHHYPTPTEPERRQAMDFMTRRAKQLLGERFMFCVMQSDIARRSKRLRRSWEHTASLVRRRHLVRLAEKLGGAQVFTGHQLSDYTETLQLRAERAIPQEAWPSLSVQNSTTGFQHPLATLSRAEVRALAEERKLLWYEDPSNSDTSIARNRLRIRQKPEDFGMQHKAPPQENNRPEPLHVHRRELRLATSEWRKLAPVAQARIVYHCWQKLAIVKRFTRNDFARAQRLPFSLPPFFVHTERLADGEFVIFRRGLGALRRLVPPAENCLPGDAVTRSVTLRRPYGHKSVTKVFSERKLSPRQRRLTWIQMHSPSNEALRIFFPDGAVL